MEERLEQPIFSSMELHLLKVIEAKGLNEAYKECVHMIESLLHTSSCWKSDSEKIADIKKLLEIIYEAE